MARHTIVCADGDEETRALIDDALLARLAREGIALAWHNGLPADDDEWLARIGAADGLLLLWSIPDQAMRAAPNLKAIAWVGTGVSTFVNIPLASELGIVVSNTPGYGSNAVAEHTLGLMLALARQTVPLAAAMRAGDWPRENVIGVELSGKTVGVVGLGGIGTRVAQLCGALGMRVLAWTRNPSAERLARAGATFAELDNLLAASDVVTLHLPHTPDTDRLLSAERIGLMARTAFLINTARAELVDEQALIEALRAGRIAGAALDVFADEPLPAGNPWRGLPNVILTPHIGWNTPEANRRSVEMAVDNLIGALTGEARNVVRD
ncbi:MAG TPA: NAD(P)-dependent oxidoreductase [Thermomicrobiales bacterium]|nr:NAD(P)-dependent oxidoreductase [Thermomicrobiales bacterium]